jgi:hypothetical protein
MFKPANGGNAARVGVLVGVIVGVSVDVPVTDAVALGGAVTVAVGVGPVPVAVAVGVGKPFGGAMAW